MLVSLLAWAVAAYLIVPRLWKLYFHYRPVVEVARVTQTSDRHPGDPVNSETCWSGAS